MNDPFGDKRDPLVKTMERNASASAGAEIDQLRALNQELVEALKPFAVEAKVSFVATLGHISREHLAKARAAVVKALGGQYDGDVY